MFPVYASSTIKKEEAAGGGGLATTHPPGFMYVGRLLGGHLSNVVAHNESPGGSSLSLLHASLAAWYKWLIHQPKG